MRAFPLVLALLLLLAGCVRPADPADDVNRASGEWVDPIIEQHDHSDPASHALWTPSMRQLAFHSLGDEPNKTRGTYGEIDIHGDRAYIGVLGDGGEIPGLLVVDISDRTNPVVLSFTPSPGTRVADVKGEPTNKWAFLAGERGVPISQSRVLRTASDATGAATAADPERFLTRNGIRVYDVSDPTAPVEVSHAPSDSGCHMVFYKKYAGGEWLFCVGVGINVYSFNGANGAVELVSRYAPSAREAAPFALGNPTEAQNELFYETTPHDMTIQDDLTTGKVLMYASYWDLGVRVVDVSDPANPVELGAWQGEGSDRYAGNVHTAMAYETQDGRRLVYAIPELFDGTSVSALFVLDATDLANIRYLGEWAPPGEHPNDGIRFSTHNFQIVDDKLYLAFYHAGVWVLDVAGDNAIAPKVLGYYLPHEVVETWQPREQTNAPDVWDVVLKDGHIYATDIAAGLYVLHYEGDTLGDPALTSTA